MRPLCSLAGLAACFVLTTTSGMAAPAAGKKPPDPEKVFARRDADKDGFLTLAEFKTGMKEPALEKAPKRFRKLDTNGDDRLSLEEFKALFAGRPAT